MAETTMVKDPQENMQISPRYLGVKAVIAKSYARIHRKNLINFGILPLIFSNPKDYIDVTRRYYQC